MKVDDFQEQLKVDLIVNLHRRFGEKGGGGNYIFCTVQLFLITVYLFVCYLFIHL